MKKLDRHIKPIFPATETQYSKDFGFLCAAKANYVVLPEVMDKLTGWVEAFQHWVYKECLKAIDEFERLEKEKALKENEALRRKLKEAGLDMDGE